MPACSSNEDCSAGVCDPTSAACVQCTTDQAAACTGTSPVCSAAHACTACATHDQCTASQTCLSDGACAAVNDVAYVAASGSGRECTRDTPCAKLTDAFATNKSIIRVLGRISEAVSVKRAGHWTVIGDATAQLTSTGDALTVADPGARLEVVDLAIVDALGSAVVLEDGEILLRQVELAQNRGLGIEATKGVVTLIRSQVHDNAKGGVVVLPMAAFHIISNMLFNNGTQESAHGAIDILSERPASTFEFNSLSGNRSKSVASAIECRNDFKLRNNIIVGIPNAALTPVLVHGCTLSHSLSFLGILDPLFDDGTNHAGDPRFLSITDLHIQPGSPAIGRADSAQLDPLAVMDIDGQPRISPADIGADQRTP